MTLDKVSEIDGSGTPISNVVVDDAGLTADGGTLFRLADGFYIYNLKTAGWKPNSGTRHRIDVRVKKAGHVDTVYSIFVVNR